MAIVKGPLLSVEARGEFADTMTYRRSKGRNVVQRYAEPTNPSSPAQVTHRALYSAAVPAARTILGTTAVADAWRTRATHLRNHQTAHSTLVQALVDSGVGVGNPVFVLEVVASGSNGVYLKWIDATTLTSTISTGPLKLFVGSSPDSMAYVSDVYVQDGYCLVPLTFENTRPLYLEIRENNVVRSGVIRVAYSSSPLPLSVIPSLLAWWHAHEDNIQLVGSDVDEWWDNDVSQPSLFAGGVGARPSWSADPSGGTGEIVFTSSHYMQQPTDFLGSIQAVAACYRFNSFVDSRCPLWFGSDPGKRFLHLPTPSTIFDDSDGQALFPSGAEDTYVNGVATHTFGNPIFLKSVIRNRDSAIDPPGRLWLNGTHTGTWRHDLKFRDLAWFTSALTATERSIIDAYFSAMYGISI